MTKDLALALGGGGARAAYQVGVMRALAERFPTLDIPILTGVSAGGINAAHFANHLGTLEEAAEDLTRIWADLDVSGVFETAGGALLWRAFKNGMRLAFGVSSTDGEHRGMVDTAPLRKTLNRALGTSTGRLPNIEKNVASGKLRAVALVTTRYATGQTVTFFSGRDIVGWERPQRRSVHTQLTVDHIMASAALPLFFPAVEVDGSWHGDGGIRLVAPLAPALHLGAGKILAISTLHRRSRKEADIPTFNGPPLPAQILGVLFNAIFLDQLDQDAHELDRVNRLLDDVPPDRRQGLRPVGLQVIRPSVDIGVLANEHEPRLPPAFRYLTRRLGTRRARTQDFLSTVMFQRDFVCRLMELGEKDGSDQAETIAAFLDS